MNFSVRVYEATKHFPPEEKYGLVSQIRRSAVSVPANIAEGVARQNTKEYIRFLYIARSSLSECDALLEISYRLGYLRDEQYSDLINLADEINRMLNSLIKNLKAKVS